MSLISPAIEAYCVSHSTRPSELARELEEFTRKNVHGSQMLIGEMEASLLTTLIHLGRVKTIVEFGTFTGYSALCMAEALPDDGKLITIDVNQESTSIARKYWERSPSGKKIQLILKPGMEAIKEIDGKFDLIFIDADKGNYSNYLLWSIDHLSDNGIIIVDNTLWSGKVVEPDGDKRTEAIMAHNKLAASMENMVKTLLPIRDGMFLIQKGVR